VFVKGSSKLSMDLIVTAVNDLYETSSISEDVLRRNGVIRIMKRLIGFYAVELVILQYAKLFFSGCLQTCASASRVSHKIKETCFVSTTKFPAH
jgi:hypothetical protein